MNPYMELPKLNAPRHVSRADDSLDQVISIAAFRAIEAIETLFSRWLERRRFNRRRRGAIADLSRLDDRLLKDIGIDRSEIRSVVEETLQVEAAREQGYAPVHDRILRGRASSQAAANDNGSAAESACCA
ncbi:MAG: DUF1127 domain-containing protein [Rhodospirillales bacterium]|nr:DUF1127 domain-containing protein [Rhodospirillales bacterium]